MTIAIVGGGVAGLSAAEALREEGYNGVLRVFGAERAIPYERPTLSKRFLTDRRLTEPPALRPPCALAEMEITIETGARVTAIHAQERRIVTAGGEQLPYDLLLLATGAAPRRLHIPGSALKGVHYLRELEDARALRAALLPGGCLAIVGGGMIGMEIAASATELGATVTVIEVSPQLMGRRVAPGFSRLLQDFHRARGVSIQTRAKPIRFEGCAGHVCGVTLEDGAFVPAETVVIGIGAAPRTELASRAGLMVDDGVIVDEQFRSSSDRIFAAGDAARVFHAGEERHVRVEQWQPAQDQGRHAAASMLGASEPYRDVPWMWSDQSDLHLQATGFGFTDATIVRRGDLHERSGVVFLGVRDGRLVAACGASLGTGVAKTIRVAQLLIERGVNVRPDELADPNSELRRLAHIEAS